MKNLFTVALIAAATPAFAQTAPAPAPAPTAAPAPVAATKFTLDTPIETLIADPAAKAVLDKDIGSDVSKHPAYDSFKAMSLNAVAPLSGGAVTDEMLKKIAVDLAVIK